MASIWSWWASDETPPLHSARGGSSQRPFSDADLARDILIVEDEVLIAWMIESLLEDAGFQSIRLATSAADALASAHERGPELIISDINLGVGDNGIEAAIRMRQIAPAPVVFISAYVDGTARTRIADEIGDAVILRKPVEQRALMAAVRELLKRPPQH